MNEFPEPSLRPVSERTAPGAATASVVLSCLGIIFGPLTIIPGIICGHVARRQIRRGSIIRGRGVALAGLIIGYVLLIIFGILATIYVLLGVA
jgi:hypothetical protein